jgi:starvation-inducible DNA-binding protein
MNTFLRIDSNHIDNLIQEMNELLANYHIYYQNLRSFHWNVYGPNFFELHRQFEEAYNETRTQIDEVAERILTLGFRPVSKFSEYLYISEITEATGVQAAPEMMETVMKDTRQMIFKLNTAIELAQKANDEGTADLLTGFLKMLEKRHWQYHAYLKMQAVTT